MKKLWSRRGETLAETLAAILIIALAVTLLASMVTAATRINITAETATNGLYDALSRAETGGGTDDGSALLSGDGVSVQIPVWITGDDLISYERKGP